MMAKKVNKKVYWFSDKNDRYSAMGFSWLFTKNKILDLEFISIKQLYKWFDLTIEWTCNMDYAGLSMAVGILWFNFKIEIRDKREWDDDGNCWAKQKEDSSSKKINYEWFYEQI